MFVFGSSPKRFGLPENSFVAVASSTWTSSPMTSLEIGRAHRVSAASDEAPADEWPAAACVAVERSHGS